MGRMWILVLLGFGIGFACEAAGSPFCRSVDLRPSAEFKMRDQGDISWCYAHTAADLLQFHFKLKDPVSAADIAIQYNQGLWPRLYRMINGTLVPETGFVKPALVRAMDSGYCPESRFPSEFWIRLTPASGESLKREPKRLNAAISEILDLQRLIKAGVLQGDEDLPFFYEFPGVGRGDFFEILRTHSRQGVLEAFRQRACDGHRMPYPADLGVVAMSFRGPSMFERFQSELESGRPISIDYFYGVLEDAGRIKKKLADLHTSIVLGQRFDEASGECQYLVKNSYGSSCSGYDSKWQCDAGYLWVGESALGEAMVSYVYLVPQEK